METETKMNRGTQCIVPCNPSESNFRSKQLVLQIINGMYYIMEKIKNSIKFKGINLNIQKTYFS